MGVDEESKGLLGEEVSVFDNQLQKSKSGTRTPLGLTPDRMKKK